MLKVANLKKIFKDRGKTVVLKDISFEVEKRQFFTIIGPSGCGKSTLLRIIAGLIEKSEGEVSWQENPKIGFVFQNFALFPYLTVKENIEFGLRMQGVGENQRKKVSAELIDEVGLSGFENHHPKELSGGMKQRVGIARALAIDPNVLILDEPFSSLDEFTAQKLRELLLSIWQKREITVVMVTHLIREALELSDVIAVLTPSPSEVEKIVEISLSRPRNTRAERFFQLEDEFKRRITV